jgi:hypothetical protein
VADFNAIGETMWFPMWLWIIPLVFLLAGRCGRRRWGREGRRGGGDAADLERTVAGQNEYIEQLEVRLRRVEEGLEFAERLLAERGGGVA